MTPAESELLAITGRELWRRAIGPGPLYRRMTNPRPGDLVLEITRWGEFDPDSIGRLVRVTGSPDDGSDIWVVEPLHWPGHEVTWGNADFVALPDRRKWVPDPGSTGVTP